MITLAFAQMVYYVGVSLDRYGADDGLTIYKRSDFAGLINLSNKTIFYYVCFVCLMRHLLSGLAHRQFALRHGDPGRALQRAAHARDRLSDLPLSADLFRDRRRAVRACPASCSPIRPTSSVPAMMHWTRSGDLIVMAVLGGMGSVLGPVIGAVALLVLEETLPHDRSRSGSSSPESRWSPRRNIGR